MAASAAIYVLALSDWAEADPGSASSPWRANGWLRGVLAEPIFVSEPHLDAAYGIEFGVGIGRARVPLAVGLDFAALRGGGATSTTPILLGSERATLLETRTRQTVFVDAWARVQPTSGLWRPYLEISGGIAMIDYVYSLRFSDADSGTTAFGEQSSAATLGLGLGLDFVIARAPDDPESTLCLSFGARHLLGSRVSSEPGMGSVELRMATTLFSIGISARTRLGGATRQ